MVIISFNIYNVDFFKFYCKFENDNIIISLITYDIMYLSNIEVIS